jgi:translation initiation factor IF-2
MMVLEIDNNLVMNAIRPVAKEVAKGYDCGMQVKNYNDIREGDILEAFREVEVKKTLK